MPLPGTEPTPAPSALRRAAPWAVTAFALVLGFALLFDGAGRTSATYDEVAYMQIAARWYRTGDQAEITRMGSPLTFWKLQQAASLWWLDSTGRRAWIDDPIQHQATLLPALRRGALWIWIAAFALTALWARSLYGNAAMALAAWLFALGPNLVAHAGLITMELPVTLFWLVASFTYWKFLETHRKRWFVASALGAGVAFSCKFTAILLPPLLAAVALAHSCLINKSLNLKIIKSICTHSIIYLIVMMLGNLVVTGFATLPISTRQGNHPSIQSPFLAWLIEQPFPSDWAGFLVQIRHQRSGGWSYLLGERRLHGWWYYYLVALAVKVPIAIFVLAAARVWQSIQIPPPRANSRQVMLWLMPLGFVLIASLGSGRNYGVRYLLPVAPLFIIWLSGLLAARDQTPRYPCAPLVALLSALGIAWVTCSIHPNHLSYFNALAGGTAGGRVILADSNLDWGQGARALASLQANDPRFADLTLYYFGATEPRHYGVVGRCHVIDAGSVHPTLPAHLTCDTTYLGVSSSLRWGPWGPPDYFQALHSRIPIAFTSDGTIAIYQNPFRLDHPR